MKTEHYRRERNIPRESAYLKDMPEMCCKRILKQTQGKNLRAMVLLALVCAGAGSAAAQRLPAGVTPEHYSLWLKPELTAGTFTGRESIDVLLARPSRTITLNALELKIESVTVGRETATVTMDPANEQATFTFPEELPAGRLRINIDFSGPLRNDLRGFYLSKTATRRYAVTQFEPTDARRAFPCFDEPAMKATFDVELDVADGDVAISNTNAVSDVEGTGAEAGRHTVRFATTPKMSTYLVAFVVGDLKCLSGQSDGVPIRACATPDKVQLAGFALQTAEFALHYYDDYFGIKYPMPKLDMIALPDFEAGAMENFGAIFYRETGMLLDEKTAGLEDRKSVATDVTHEISHQWFGDLVTMQWWDNLWLNEGFATWMENKSVEAWQPGWHMDEVEAETLDEALNYDAQPVTHPVRMKAETRSEINELFDTISYNKAGSVLAMMEQYEGKEVFREGVHRYLEAHMYGNATAEDFWRAQTEVSGKPVDKIMESFVVQAGVPMLHFSVDADGRLDVTQQRFYKEPLTGDAARPGWPEDLLHPAQKWTVPVCVTLQDGSRTGEAENDGTQAGATDCMLLKRDEQKFKLPAETELLYGNARYKGYYRSDYDAAEYAAMVAHAETELTPVERTGLVDDQWAMMRAERRTAAEFMDLVQAVSHDADPEVVRNALGGEGVLNDRIADEAEADAMSAWERREFGPMYRALPPMKKGEPEETREMRTLLFGLLGGSSDAGVIAEARVLGEKYLEDPDSVDRSLGETALSIMIANADAASGDAALYDRLLEQSKTATDPQVQSDALDSLAEFKDPKLVQRTLEMVAAGKVRNQDSWYLLVIELSSHDTREQALKFAMQNWGRISAQLTESSGADVVESMGGFCSVDKRTELQQFFGQIKVEAATRAMQSAIDNISGCMELKRSQEPSLHAWLVGQGVLAK